MGRGLLLILRETGPEPSFNKWKLGRKSGVSYKVVKSHCRGGLVSGNIQEIISDFRGVLQRYSSPGALSINLIHTVKTHRYWFASSCSRYAVT